MTCWQSTVGCRPQRLCSAARWGCIGLMLLALRPGAGAQPLGAQVWTPGTPATPPAEPVQDRTPSTLRPAARIDYLGGASNALFVGAGLSARAGTYLRVGANVGAGPDGPGGDSNRLMADVTARFMLDPFRQSRAGVSLGGGVGARYQHDRVRAFALLIVDVEGGGGAGWAPFLRVGVGGGARVAAGLRRAVTTGR